MRQILGASTALLIALAGLGASLVLTGGGSAATQQYTGPFPVTICHPTGSNSNPWVEITFQNQQALDGHTQRPHGTGADIVPKPSDGCPGGGTTSTTTTTTVPGGGVVPPVLGTAGLRCEPAEGQGPYLRLNVVAGGNTATTIGMEKDVLSCSGASTQTRDLETFIEVVQTATATGLDDVSVRVHTALCVKDFSVGRVQCVRKNVSVGGMKTTPLYGCRTAKTQPGDPVSMLSKSMGNWFKTTKLEKEIVTCANGMVGDLYLFTDVVSANPPTTASSATSFRGVICWWNPSDGVPPTTCNTVKTT